MANLDMKLELDTSDLDAALEKAEKLKTALEQIKALQSELASWPMRDRSNEFAAEVERAIAEGSRRPARRFAL